MLANSRDTFQFEAFCEDLNMRRSLCISPFFQLTYVKFKEKALPSLHLDITCEKGACFDDPPPPNFLSNQLALHQSDSLIILERHRQAEQMTHPCITRNVL